MEKGALDGIRVADFSQVWAGPYVTMLMAFMGAQVIKVESEGRPDFSRMQSITTRKRYPGRENSPVFHDLNLNKLDVTINSRNPKGVDLAKKLVAISDVVVENFRPGVMDRLGLGYEALREVKEDIIYFSSSTRGNFGPESRYAGFAVSFAGLSGLAELTGYPDRPPQTMAGRMDLISGVTGTFSILAALNYRQKTGKGQQIDMASTDSISVLLGDVFMDYTMNQRVQTRKANKDDIMAPHNCYRCKGEDKWISIAISTDEEWNSFAKAIGNPEWSREKKYADAFSRKQNEEELDKLISEWTKNYTPYEVMELLQRQGIAAMPSLNSEEIYNDLHLKERKFSTELEHPVVGKQKVVGLPWKFSETPGGIYRHSPTFGQDNQYVFSELLGLSDNEIQTLKDEQAIY